MDQAGLSNTSITLADISFQNYMRLAGITILYYDFLLTFPGEVAYCWRKPNSATSCLFFLNRYFSILVSFVINVENFAPFRTDMLCNVYALFRQVALFVAQIVVCCILILRTYALWGRSRRILVCMIATAVMLLTISFWAMTDEKHSTSIRLGCHSALAQPTAIHLAIAWECLLVFDILIVSLTLYKSYKEISWSRTEGTGILNKLILLMLRDGAVYFTVMACTNLANVLTFYVLPPARSGTFVTVTSSISVMLVSRLMLNLHKGAAVSRAASGTSATVEFVPMQHRHSDNSSCLV
ncbi:hypothetical protein EIP91_000216 [Steccherinum ochraceum]|uniref:DUF6533 domain-containing protein n=1 Tax=Steccherinum ochraceum TaxID=92696 RepID=A0A4R0RPS7_9APHY|nr:hypothetical protein EIP91_000216 [Steccherinum ochraceum]